MIDEWVGHYHSQQDNPLSRLPAALKLGAALGIIIGTVLVPAGWTPWFAGVLLLLALAAVMSRVPLLFLAKRLALLSPLVLGVALVNALQPAYRGSWRIVAVRSLICLLTVILVSNTTPFSKILRILRATRVPALLVTVIFSCSPTNRSACAGRGPAAPSPAGDRRAGARWRR